MELQTFIESSLTQIIKGLANTGKLAKEHGASLNPRQKQWRFGEGLYFDKATGAVLSTIEFDIAVTATEGTRTKAGIGVAIASVVLGSQGESTKGNNQTSRIKFSLPVVLPSSSNIVEDEES
jgi:hypothetical protein